MDEIRRVDHSRLRRRLLYEEFENDLIERVKKNIGNVRRAAWGNVDLTANPYQSMWAGAAALYDEEPGIIVPAGNDALCELVAETGFWAQQQRVQRDTLALREMFVRADVDDDGQLSFRPAFPDMISATAHPRRPSVPLRIRESIHHERLGWLRHDLDVRDPANPAYRVYDRNGELVTKEALGDTYDGADYPYRDTDGAPFLPYVLYHAAETGCLFDAFTHRAIVEGSLNIGVLLTFYGHLVRNAAWAQRYAVNLEPVGLEVRNADGSTSTRREVVTDPATLLLLKQVDGTAPGSTGQWSAPGDPEGVLRSIGMYERRIQLLAGFAPPDVTRQEADIRSGYSLAVDREAMRAKQRMFEPQFRRGDQAVLRMAACLHNRVKSTRFSEIAADYRPVYKGLPRSPAEIRVHLEEVKAKQDAGMIGPVTAYRELHPEVSYDEAVLQLAQVATEKTDVETATKGLLRAAGIESVAVPVTLEVGKVALLPLFFEKAQQGLIPVDTVKNALITALGFTAEAAAAMTDPLKPIAPPTP